MQNNYFIDGCNFSGRSDKLKQMLTHPESQQHRCFYVGPYGEASLSGFATYASEEIFIYHGHNDRKRDFDFYPDNLQIRDAQRVSAFSGGEQVLLALYCFAGSKYETVGIDTALEQLDMNNRARVMSFMKKLFLEDRHFILIDNRIEDDIISTIQNVPLKSNNSFILDMDAFKSHITAQSAPTIKIRNLDFSYNSSIQIFKSLSLDLVGGNGYRLRGDNGTGKSTLLKILTGVLPSNPGTIIVNDRPYQPNKNGNSIIALSMQNPDDQWAGISIQKDITCKLKALKRESSNRDDSNYNILDALQYFGLSKDIEHHLLDLPKALRKRLSWLWPIGSFLPWLAFDEPTIGQDKNAVHQLADIMNDLIRKGYGVIFITHNESFAEMINHQDLQFRDRNIINLKNKTDNKKTINL